MNRKRLYENIMKDLRRAFKRSLNEDILDDIDIDDPKEDDVTSKINKQNQEMVNQIADDAVQQMIDKRKELPGYIYNSIAVWKPKNQYDLKTVIDISIGIYGNEVNLNWIDVSEITDMHSMFAGSEFNGDISKWNVSNVTDISQWDVSNVTSMFEMFHSSKFNRDISQWDVSNVTNMECMFYYSKFNRDISQWDVSNVTNMNCMFSFSKFNKVISKWNVSNVTDMRCMFYKSKFNGDISQWDVSNVTNMRYMFAESKFNGDISQWDVSNVTNMNSMFQWSQFNGDISQWNVSNVTDMLWMFDNCLIKKLPAWYKNK